jgi:hypothetical protein
VGAGHARDLRVTRREQRINEMSYRLAMVLCLQACAARGSDPKVTAAPASNHSRPAVASNSGPGKEGDLCTPANAIVDEQFRPVDMNRSDSVMAAAGHPVFVCAPVTRATSGVVFEDATHKPIAGAIVTIEAWQAMPPIGGLAPNRRLLKTVDVRTDSHGRWEASESAIWLPGILAADGFPYIVRSYCVHADGHDPFVVDPWKSDTRAPDDSMSEIRLRASAGAVSQREAQTSTCGLPLGPPL